MMAWVAGLLMVCGASFVLIGAVGILRMPDVWMRMQASSKAATLGIGCLALGLAAYRYEELTVVMRAVIVISFTFVSVPVAAHMIGRAAYLMGLPAWEGTHRDELRKEYGKETAADE